MVNYSFHSCWHKCAESEAALSKRQAPAGVHHVQKIPFEGLHRIPPPDMQLPLSQRAKFVFREQRKQNLNDHLLKRKKKLHTRRKIRYCPVVDTGEWWHLRVRSKMREVLKPKTKRYDKENVHIPRRSKNDIIMKKNCIPLKPSNELTNSTIAIETCNLENSNQTLKLLPIKDEHQDQCITLSQCFIFKTITRLQKNRSKMLLTCSRNLFLDPIMAKWFNLRWIHLENLYKSKMRVLQWQTFNCYL